MSYFYEEPYSTVVEKFPHVDKEDIKIRYGDEVSLAAIRPLCYSDCSWLQHFMDWILIRKPKSLSIYNPDTKPCFEIIIGNLFLTLDKYQQEAVLAHELGHYKYLTKHPSTMRVLRHTRWAMHNHAYDVDEMSSLLKFFSKKHKTRIEQLKKWYLLSEMYADEWTIKTGYGEKWLDTLRQLRDLTPKKDEVDKRIKNLEEKILKA